MRTTIVMMLELKTGQPIQNPPTFDTTTKRTATSMPSTTDAMRKPRSERRLWPFVWGTAKPRSIMGSEMLKTMCTGTIPAIQIQFTPSQCP